MTDDEVLTCPECSHPLTLDEGDIVCPDCGYKETTKYPLVVEFKSVPHGVER